MAQTPIDELELSGNVSNLNRALKRRKNAVPLTESQKTEVAQLDALIAQAMKCCKRGHTFRHEKNPAFQNLALLVKTRETLLKGKAPYKKSAKEIMNDVDKLLGITPEEKAN